jgi:hypothetical protein
MNSQELAYHPAPRAADIYVVTVGTTATAAVDLMAYFEFTAGQSRKSCKATIRPFGTDATVGFVFGGSSVAAPVLATRSDQATTSHGSQTAGRCSRVKDGGERMVVVTNDRRYFRLISDVADTVVEIEVERG